MIKQQSVFGLIVVESQSLSLSLSSFVFGLSGIPEELCFWMYKLLNCSGKQK